MNVDKNIADAERILNYNFNDEVICAEALQMAAPLIPLCINGKMHSVNLNTRLAVQGDAGATAVLCEQWYAGRDKFGIPNPPYYVSLPDLSQGNPQTPAAWNTTRQGALSNAGLAGLARSLGLRAMILTAPGHEGYFGDKMLATALEALLGAVYLDGGETALKNAMNHIGLVHRVVTSSFPCP